MKKMLLYLFFLLLAVQNLDGQNTISGIVLDEKNHQPIELATVYIDGTSKSVMTDANGSFSIKDISFPCRLVVSRVGYELRSYQLSYSSEEQLSIALKEQHEPLSEISVSGKNLRKQNIEEFKNAFLGDDYWGNHAGLEQQEALLFSHSQDTIQRAEKETISTFNVRTRSSLTVKLPLLGYNAYVDIVSYAIKSKSTAKTIEYDLHNRFVPYATTSKRESKKIENNRREIYYNSSLYFCRSLFYEKLKENGFVIAMSKKPNDTLNFNIAPYILRKSDNEIALIGLKGKTLKLTYFYSSRNAPVNLTNYVIKNDKPVFSKRHSANETTSFITLLSDTCFVYRNGITDNDIVFSGKMGASIGSRLLPLDYEPSEMSFSLQSIKNQQQTLECKNTAVTVKSDTTVERGINKFISNYKSFGTEYPQEKVYLHFDNTAYYLGETVWFKAYVVKSDRNNLTNLSKVLYVEILNAEGHLLDQRKLKIEEGQCHGEFKLNPVQYAGFYEIRAYTRYMLNFGEQNFFSRVFPVYDKPKQDGEYKAILTERPRSQRIEQKRQLQNQNQQLELSFFPEGGTLIQGISSKVAFKATNDEGEGVQVKCTLYKDKHDSICSFNSWHQGMGSFELTPDSGDYSVAAQWHGKTYRFELPKAIASGVHLSVDNSDQDSIYLLIHKTPNVKSQKMGLTLTCRGILYGSDVLNMESEKVVALNFPKRKLPSGVTQITLFDEKGRILSERLVFINHQSQMKISCTQSKSQYHPFELVSMSFSLTDARNNPVQTSFSVSVCDAATSSIQPKGNNILTDLLLSSEIRGYIHEPGYYFENDSSSRKEALDLLLLVQGWSRYSWKQMAGTEKFVPKQPLEDGLHIDGKVESLFLKRPKPNMNFSMVLLADSTSQRGKCLTDSAGNFYFRLIDFQGSALLIMQTKQEEKKQETFIRLNRQFSPELKMLSYSELNGKQAFKTFQSNAVYIDSLKSEFDEDLEKLLLPNNGKLPLSKRNNLLKQVTVKANRLPVKVGAKYEVEKELDRRIDQAEWLPADLKILLNFTCKYYNATRNMYKGKTVCFMVENSGKKGFDISNIMDGGDGTETSSTTDNKTTNDGFGPKAKDKNGYTFPNLDGIESVTFIEDYASIFRISGNGLISPSTTCIGLIKLKKKYVKEPYSIRNTSFEGYSYTRSFYSPQYDKAILPDEKDYRRTLYWNPDVKTDATGKATVSFFNNGSCKAMNISAETVTENGVIGTLNQ